MSLTRNFGLLWYLLPFFKSPLIKNKPGLTFSVLTGSKIYKLKLNDGLTIDFPSAKFNNLLHMIGILSFAFSYKIKDNDKIELSFDEKNKITIPTKNLSYEDDNLLELLFLGVKYGADFIFGNANDGKNLRDKTIKIYENKDRKIVQVSNGIKFYLDSIHPGNSIVETFVQKIHMIKHEDDFTNKIVVDIGAECGDTALYYASLNATVYSFEPIKSNYDDMIENIKLNPQLAKKITPINAAIGEDKILKFYQDPITPNIGSSFVYNWRGENAKITNVQGYSLETALTKYKINHVDLLKTDCKNCEFFFNEKSLENVDMVKIETVTKNKDDIVSEKHMEDLLSLLKKVGFECVLYKIAPYDYASNRVFAHILGKKIRTLKKIKTPNIFLLTIDSMRADRFYGPKKSAITPNFDHIIKNGLFFTHCITPSDQTGTSLASIFTGKYPASSGVTQYNFNFDFTTFFDELEKLGYNLYSCVTDLLMFKKITKNFKQNLEYIYGGTNKYPHLDNDLGSKILKNFLNKKMDEPWMFYCHLMDLKDPTVWAKDFEDKKFGESIYDRNLSALDVWIGKFLESIDLTNTLFVITADHGEYVISSSDNLERSIRKISNVGKKFGFLESIGKKPFSKSLNFARKMKQKQAEHLTPFEKRNYFLKRAGTNLFDDLVKVPLLFIGYGIKEPKIISSQVRHVDIFPTIFEFTGLPINNSSIDGKSNVSTYKGIESYELPAYIESATTNPKKSGAVIGVRTSNYKYFRSRNNPKKNVKLYDLQKDPKEEHNILDTKLIKKMEEKLSHFIGKSKSFKKNKINEDEAAELEKELRKMGYID